MDNVSDVLVIVLYVMFYIYVETVNKYKYNLTFLFQYINWKCKSEIALVHDIIWTEYLQNNLIDAAQK